MSCPHGNPIGGCDTCNEVDAAFEAGKRSALAEQPAQQEPVGKVNELFDEAVIEQCGFDRELLVYTSPQPSKPWVGLTTADLDEIDAPIRERGSATIAEIYRAIEAKLREKNAPQQSKEDA